MSQSNYTIVSIEGNIGSGKSTLMEHLKETYKNNPYIIFLKEPVDEWSTITDVNGVTILEKFYADQNKYSFAFQMMAYISRLNVLRDALNSLDTTSDKKYVIITERSLNTDRYVFAKMLYESGKMEEVFYKIYLNWFDTFSQEFPVHKIIYVKVEPEVCHARISKRAREGEDCIPVEYLDSCHNYHEEMLQNMNENLEKLLLDGNVDIYENATHMKDWLHTISNFIKIM
jgi:deoxyadenosine/deoxycytidine kinase